MDNNIFKIGLTGPSGSGKSQFAHFFSCMGIPVLDADEIYHSLVSGESECLSELCREFGCGIKKDGRLDRVLLGSIVFADGAGDKLRRLNEITHKHVIKRTDELICKLQKEGHRIFVTDAPLLIEAGMDKSCNTVISVIASEDVRCRRIMERDGITEEKAMLRICSQKPLSFYEQASEYIIQNEDGVGRLEDEFRKLYARLGLNIWR